MEQEKVFNDTQPAVVEPENPAPDTGESILPEAPTEQQEQGAAIPAAEQSHEENAKFAEVRRRAEAEAREQAKVEMDKGIAALFGDQVNPYTGRNITSHAEYQAYSEAHRMAQEAEKNGVSLEQHQKNMERLREEIKEKDPEFLRAKEENQSLKTQLITKLKHDDLAQIKAHNPKETAKSVDELGALFLNLRGSGISAVDAYEAVCAVNAKKAPPPGMGDLSQSPDMTPKDKYANMSDDDFEKMIVAAQRGELKKG